MLKAFSPQPQSPATELDVFDFTQEIAAPLEDLMYRDELTLSQLDFEELESGLDL